MAHFAELDNQNNVIRVIVVNNSDITDSEGNESESIGKNFCTKLLGGNWIQTSYNGSFRKNFAGKGWKYDKIRDAFIPPKVYDSWSLNEQTCLWEAPTQKPEGNYIWDEISQSWLQITNENGD